MGLWRYRHHRSAYIPHILLPTLQKSVTRIAASNPWHLVAMGTMSRFVRDYSFLSHIYRLISWQGMLVTHLSKGQSLLRTRVLTCVLCESYKDFGSVTANRPCISAFPIPQYPRSHSIPSSSPVYHPASKCTEAWRMNRQSPCPHPYYNRSNR